MIILKEFKNIKNISLTNESNNKEDILKDISFNELILETIKNKSLSLIVVGLIFLVIGIIFIPLSIVSTVRETYFNFLSLEAFICYFALFIFLVFFIIGIINYIRYIRIKKNNKEIKNKI